MNEPFENNTHTKGTTIEKVQSMSEYEPPVAVVPKGQVMAHWQVQTHVDDARTFVVTNRNQGLLELQQKIFTAIVGNSSVESMQVSHVRDISLEAAEAVLDCEWVDE